MNRAIFGLVGLVWACSSIVGQESREQLNIVNLQAPIYPPMASSTVEVQGGPPMLRQAAVDSATQSRFRVEDGEARRHISLIYRFVLDSPTSCEHDGSYPRLESDRKVITITEQAALLCDPASMIQRVRFRSVKCLYAWKCGSKTP
jgi:hypothetical protein